MLTLTLPDGSSRQVAPGTRPIDVANGIGKRLAAAAVAAKVDGQIVDLDRELTADASFQLLTDRDAEALDVLRHSTAHVMARAVLRLFPNAELAFGPTTDTGFYYDIRSPKPVTEDDFPRIEAEMAKIVKEAEPFERFERSVPDGRKLIADLQQPLKVEHIDESLKDYPSISFYRQGEFVDLCRGPHIPHAGKIGAFKVLSIAGAYWKNDQTRPQLQRLYGTAFFDKKAMDAYLTQLEEARKRDHRVLGKQLKLFTISQTAGQGLILWMPKGATVRHLLEGFIREELVKRGYQGVYTPHIGHLGLYRTSGHFPYYADSQYPPMYFNPLVQTVDTWAALHDKKLLTPEQEAAFLGVVKAIAEGRDADPGRRPAAVHRCRDEGRGARPARRLQRGTAGRQARGAERLARAAGGLPAQADELPAPHPDLQGRAEELPRPAGEAGRVRHRLPLRAVGRTRRHDPGPRVHPGRRPPVRHPGTGGGHPAGGDRPRPVHPEHPRT